MSENVTDAAPSAAKKGKTPTWLVAAISGIVGLFYAYAVWNAIGNLVATLDVFAAAGLALNALGWFIWIFAAVFPLLVWGASRAPPRDDHRARTRRRLLAQRGRVHHAQLGVLPGLSRSALECAGAPGACVTRSGVPSHGR